MSNRELILYLRIIVLVLDFVLVKLRVANDDASMRKYSSFAYNHIMHVHYHSIIEL